MTRPDLSVVVVVHDMAREAPRTLLSLSADYQLDIEPGRYEVIVVDNGSDVEMRDAVTGCGDNFRYEYIADAAPSPAAAMNRGAALAEGRWLGLMIDGARMVTPGVLRAALAALAEDGDRLVETLGFHLGPDLQNRSIQHGYDRTTEDALLAMIGWPADGYRLFEIATLSGTSRAGWFGAIAESNCMFLSAENFARHGGYDESFDEPGGGYVNPDLYRRMLQDSRLSPVRVTGEGSFHQLHGGAATGGHPLRLAVKSRRWRRQYTRIRGTRYRRPDRRPALYDRAGRDERGRA